MKKLLKDGTISKFNPRVNEVARLLSVYASIQKAITELTAVDASGNEQLIFSTSNIVGEYAEILACDKLDLCQEIASNKAYDAIDDQGNKYQIKSRWLSSAAFSSKREFGAIDEDVLDDIDYVLIILFNQDFTINFAYKIDIPTYKKYAHVKVNKGKSGLALIPSNKCIQELDAANMNITKLLS